MGYRTPTEELPLPTDAPREPTSRELRVRNRRERKKRRPPVKLAFRPDIEGLRGVAIVIGVLYHLDFPIPGGIAGMDIFFPLSGYLITSLLMAEYQRARNPAQGAKGAINFGAFYARRSRRLMPAALTTVAVTLLLSKLLFNQIRFAEAQVDAFWSTFWAENFHLMSLSTDYFAPGLDKSPFQQFWSLAVEEQFYIVWPAIFIASAGFNRWVAPKLLAKDWQRRLLTVTVALGLISLWWSYAFTVSNPAASYFSPFTRAWDLLFGAALAAVPFLRKGLSPKGSHLSAWAGAGMIAMGLVVINHSMGYPGIIALLPTTGTILLLLAGINTAITTPVAKALSAGPVRWVGKISYSLYLWHWPLIVFAAALVPKSDFGGFPRGALLFALSIAVAWASWRFIEQPFQHLNKLRENLSKKGQKWTWSNPLARKAGVMMLGTIVVVILIALWARPSVNSTQIDQAVSSQVVRWAAYDGKDLAPGAATDATGDLGQKRWLAAVRKAAGIASVSKAAIQEASLGRSLSPDASCFTVRSYAAAMNCGVQGAGGADMAWPNGLSKNVALVGNSVAAQWREVIGSVLPTGTQVIPFTMVSCDPTAPATDHSRNAYNDDCGNHVTQVDNDLARLKPGLIIVATPHEAGPAAQQFLEHMKSYSPKVLFISPVPPHAPFEQCLDTGTNVRKCNGPTYPQILDEEPTYASAARAAGASWMSGAAIFCFQRICPAFVNEKPVQFDGFHLTRDTLWMVRGFMRDAIEHAVGAKPAK
mgnify:CR=1 FL=1